MEKVKPTNLSKAEIQELAEDFHKEMECYIPVNVNLVISRLGGKVEYFNPRCTNKEEYENTPSLRVFSKTEFVINILDCFSLSRDNTSLTHDLAHYVLHSKRGKLEVEADRYGGNNRVEWEANWWAWAFLMPKTVFLKEAYACNKNICTLSHKFMVPGSVVSIRLNDLEENILDFQI